MDKVNITDRISKLRKSLEELQLEAAVLVSVENRIYFSQFSGSSGVLVITKDSTVLLTDSRYSEQAAIQAPNFEVIRHKNSLVEGIGEYLKGKDIKRIGIEGSLPLNFFQLLEKEILNGSFEVIDKTIMGLRKIKDDYEISCIQKGIKLCEMAFDHILTYIQPGVSEKDIGVELEYLLKKNGADQIKSNLVVASGERSAFPHGLPTERKVNLGEFVKMDIGAIVNGYYSDFARTVVVGEATSKQKEIYHIVREAQETTLKQIGPGMTAAEIDQIGRSFIHNAGYGEQFGHGLGHSLGLNIHELPILRSNDQTELEPGMVITVEPGIYIPGWGGVRIEDLVVIKENGYKNLTSATKELQVIQVKEHTF
jgi:Xaa-Pro aminopeptidase